VIIDFTPGRWRTHLGRVFGSGGRAIAQLCTMLSRTAVRAAAPVFLIVSWANPILAQPAANGGPKFLIHGNYCGPGNNAPLAPIDALDAACAHHDACTPDVGLPSKVCNLRLEREAEAVARDPRQPEDLRSLAEFVAAYASSNPSSAVPQVRAAKSAR
jgi:hypothetical protein